MPEGPGYVRKRVKTGLQRSKTGEKRWIQSRYGDQF